MKTLKHILILSFALISLNSCKKIKQHKPTVVNFEVINPITQQGYPDVYWKITQYESQGFLEPLKETLFMEGYTDENGKARIEFKRPMSKKFKYGLDILDPPVTDGIASEYRWSNLKPKTEQDITCYVGVPVYPVVLHVQNNNCFDSNDNAIIDFKNQESNFFKELRYDDYNIVGCTALDTTLGFITDEYPYTITVTRNGITTTEVKSLKVPPGTDTLYIYY
jgi:hypothetical protein